jgi:hypothetical protein
MKVEITQQNKVYEFVEGKVIVHDHNKIEFDQWLSNLIGKNGVTKSVESPAFSDEYFEAQIAKNDIEKLDKYY